MSLKSSLEAISGKNESKEGLHFMSASCISPLSGLSDTFYTETRKGKLALTTQERSTHEKEHSEKIREKEFCSHNTVKSRRGRK
jgi:hypothetical protein